MFAGLLCLVLLSTTAFANDYDFSRTNAYITRTRAYNWLSHYQRSSLPEIQQQHNMYSLVFPHMKHYHYDNMNQPIGVIGVLEVEVPGAHDFLRLAQIIAAMKNVIKIAGEVVKAVTQCARLASPVWTGRRVRNGQEENYALHCRGADRRNRALHSKDDGAAVQHLQRPEIMGCENQLAQSGCWYGLR